MDRLSIYELLSFVIPGAIAIEFINFSSVYVLKTTKLITAESFSDGLLFFAIALFIGCLIHIITFKLIEYRWYKRLVYKPIEEIKNDEYISKILPDLKEKCKSALNTENICNENLFDSAYYYLEVKEKISQAKNFQSIYFLFRNIVTLALFILPANILILLTSLFTVDCLLTKKVIWMIIGNIVIGGLSLIVAQWFRVKMIDRVFGLYYAELTHHKEN